MANIVDNLKNLFISLPQPEPTKFANRRRPPTKRTDTDKEQARKHHLRACFAAMRTLTPQLNKAGLTDRQLWDAIIKKCNVESRATLSETNLAVIAAKLNGAIYNNLFTDLLDYFGVNYGSNTT